MSASQVEKFLSEMCEVDREAVTSVRLLYQEYLGWCLASGAEFPTSRPRFKVMVDRTIPVTTTRLGPHCTGARAYKGLRMRVTLADECDRF